MTGLCSTVPLFITELAEAAEKELEADRGKCDASDAADETLVSLRLRSTNAFLDVPCWLFSFIFEWTRTSEEEAEERLMRGSRLRGRDEVGFALLAVEAAAALGGEGEGLGGVIQSSERSSSQGCMFMEDYGETVRARDFEVVALFVLMSLLGLLRVAERFRLAYRENS